VGEDKKQALKTINLVKNWVGILLAIFIVFMNMVYSKEISAGLLTIPAMLLGFDVGGLIKKFSK